MNDLILLCRDGQATRVPVIAAGDVDVTCCTTQPATLTSILRAPNSNCDYHDSKFTTTCVMILGKSLFLPPTAEAENRNYIGPVSGTVQYSPALVSIE